MSGKYEEPTCERSMTPLMVVVDILFNLAEQGNKLVNELIYTVESPKPSTCKSNDVTEPITLTHKLYLLSEYFTNNNTMLNDITCMLKNELGDQKIL